MSIQIFFVFCGPMKEMWFAHTWPTKMINSSVRVDWSSALGRNVENGT